MYNIIVSHLCLVNNFRDQPIKRERERDTFIIRDGLSIRILYFLPGFKSEGFVIRCFSSTVYKLGRLKYRFYSWQHCDCWSLFEKYRSVETKKQGEPEMINRAGSAPLALKWGGNRWEEKIVSDEDACLEGFLLAYGVRAGEDWMEAATDQTTRL